MGISQKLHVLLNNIYKWLATIQSDPSAYLEYKLEKDAFHLIEDSRQQCYRNDTLEARSKEVGEARQPSKNTLHRLCSDFENIRKRSSYSGILQIGKDACTTLALARKPEGQNQF
jgi:hypothetical protein